MNSNPLPSSYGAPNTTVATTTPPPVEPPSSGVKSLLQLPIIGALIIALLIPLGLVRLVLSEREERKDEAVASITGSWGGSQTMIGPILVVPYKYTIVSRERPPTTATVGGTQYYALREDKEAYAYFLPEVLDITSTLKPTTRQYGIYKAVLYQADLSISGEFAKPDFSEWKIKDDNIDWDNAIVALHISDLRSAASSLSLNLNGQELPMLPGSRLPGYDNGAYVRIPATIAQSDKLEFSTAITLNGSHAISIMPSGRQTTVNIDSTWPDPKFQGAYLPEERTITPQGFEARWKMSYYGRSLPQQWSDRDNNDLLARATTSDSLFGVGLLTPIDHYRLVERSIKYGILFLVMVFTTFFIFETRSKSRIHPVQYTLVGAALVMFFLLLLALSELLSFSTAYTIGGAACTLLITLYSIFALKSTKRAITIATALTTIYAMLYVILQQQDYALLLGTALIFTMLAIAMFTTRHIRW